MGNYAQRKNERASPMFSKDEAVLHIKELIRAIAPENAAEKCEAMRRMIKGFTDSGQLPVNSFDESRSDAAEKLTRWDYFNYLSKWAEPEKPIIPPPPFMVLAIIQKAASCMNDYGEYDRKDVQADWIENTVKPVLHRLADYVEGMFISKPEAVAKPIEVVAKPSSAPNSGGIDGAEFAPQCIQRIYEPMFEVDMHAGRIIW